MAKKRSFFERLTGGIKLEDEEEMEAEETRIQPRGSKQETQVRTKGVTAPVQPQNSWLEEEDTEGELTVDVYQTPNDIVVQSFVAGVRPEDLSISITRDMITIKGKREENKNIDLDNMFIQELYWGSFSRTILLPQEIEPEEAEAIEKHGLLIIKLPKIDKDRQTNLKVKSV